MYLQRPGHKRWENETRAVAQPDLIGEKVRLKVLGVAGGDARADNDFADEAVDDGRLAHIGLSHHA